MGNDGGVHNQGGWRDQLKGGVVFGEGLSSVHPKRLMFGQGVWRIHFNKGIWMDKKVKVELINIVVN